MARKPPKPVKATKSLDAPPTKKDGSIIFFHPDLGIGGAERLVVDAAVGLQALGNRVIIFTNHCDPKHCFDECRNGTLDVRVRAGNLIPISIFGRLTILCAILRHFHLLLWVALTGELPSLRPRAFIVDQLSAGLPLLQYLVPASPILFYCHFPDLLLAHGRSSIFKRIYRYPFDKLEEWSMGFANSVAVNSEFTKTIVSKTWPGLAERVPVEVVYPCVDTGVLDKEEERMTRKNSERLLRGEQVLLSINRFERKKDIGLAIKAFAAIPVNQREGVRLVLAGGYDARISENVSYHTELQTLCTTLSLPHATITTPLLTALIPPVSTTPVLFLPSISNEVKAALLRTATLLVYTPRNEHFGIVPLEAMRVRLPVLATSTGGPVETIVHDVTGWLHAPEDVPAWTDTMIKTLNMSDAELKVMGDKGQERVSEMFSRDRMAASLETVANELRGERWFWMNTILNCFAIAMAFAIGLGGAYMFRRVTGRTFMVPE